MTDRHSNNPPGEDNTNTHTNTPDANPGSILHPLPADSAGLPSERTGGPPVRSVPWDNTAGTTTSGGRQAGLWGDAWRQLRRSPVFWIATSIIFLFGLMAIVPGLFTDADPHFCSLERSVESPSREHPFGYDIQGCDYYARVIYGARVSMTAGVLVATVASLFATIFGALAGYYSGLLDTIIARLTDVWFGIPTVLGAIVVLSTVGNRGILEVSLVLAALGWTTMLRLMRSAVLAEKNADYVRAAQALGAPHRRVIVRHILPNSISPLIVYATIFVGISITTEATLSFLGVGLQLPSISWGLMISTAQNRILQRPHLLIYPGICLSLVVLSFIMLGDILRDALDPKLR